MRVHVAAFGKHPGWDDHIEEIGLDSELLVRAKRILYTEGLAGNIDAGAWEKLENEQRLATFNHVFYWRTTEGLLIGRMWSSRDGKGRTKYPMVVCAHIEGVPAEWAITETMPRLAAIEEKCAQTGSAELVRLAIGEARRGLEDAGALLLGNEAGDRAGLLGRLVNDPVLARTEMGAEPTTPHLGLVRVLYEIEREMAGYRAIGSGRSKTRIAGPAPQHLRVPRCLGALGEGARAWMTLMDQEVAASAPILVLEPIEHSFLDVIVGEPKPPQLFCVRASEKGLGLTSQVPYTMDPGFVQQAEATIEGWIKGDVVAGANGTAEGESRSGGSGRRTLVIVGAVLGVVAAIGLLFMLMGGGGDKGPAPENVVDTPGGGPSGPTGTIPGPGAVAPTAISTAPAKPEPKGATKPVGTAGAVALAPDPRTAWGLDGAIGGLRRQLDKLDSDLAGEGTKPDAALREKLDRVVQRAGIVRATPWSASNRDSVVRDMAEIDSQVADMGREVLAAQAAVHARVAAFLAERAGVPGVTMEPLRRAWVTGLSGIDPTLGWAEARSRAEGLEKSLKGVEAQVGTVLLPEVPANSSIDAGALRAAVVARRDRAVDEAVSATLSGNSARAEQAASQLRSWIDEANALIATGSRLESLLGSAGQGEEAAALVAQLKSSAVFGELGGAFGPVLRQVESVRSVQSETEPARLIEALRSAASDTSGRRVSEASLAWAKLAEGGWPATGAQLTEASALLAGPMDEAAGRVTDAGQRQVVAAQSAATAQRMWTQFVAARAADAADLATAVESREAFKVGDTEVASLPGWVQYNIRRYELGKGVRLAAALTGKERADVERGAVDRFAGQVKAMPGAVASDQRVAPLLAQLGKLAEPGADVDLSKLGPGAAGWKLIAPTAAGDSLTFAWAKPGGLAHTIQFQRVEAAGETVSFVATTEVSVGVFADAVTVAEQWDVVKQWLATFPPGGTDRRRGPRVWDWSLKDGEVMTVARAGSGDSSRGWLRYSSSMVEKSYYPADGTAPEPPSPQHPMQFVSPRAAVFAARLLGCRLPTPGEWQGAVASGPVPPPGPGGSNVRDAAWKRQYDHIRGLNVLAAEWPGGGVFWPAGSQKLQPNEDGTPAVEVDDGVVWFAAISQGGGGGASKFHHLVGNVAEFVFEDAAALEAIGAPTEQGIDAALGKGEKLKVIGASALSPVDVVATAPQAVNLSRSGEGYSDVGFRLAFSAPRSATAAGVSDRLGKALESGAYLDGPGR